MFKAGFAPKGTGNNLLAHTKSSTTPGNFVSTSINKNIAKEFAGKNGYVYEIRASKYIDVNKVLGKNSPNPYQFEFSIPGGVSNYQIKGAWSMKNGNYISNTYYYFGK